MFPQDHIGIVADNANRRVTIFSTDTLTALEQIPLNADVIDAVITPDCNRAVVTSFGSRTMFQIDLCERPAMVIGSVVTSTNLEDVQLTPDGRFALAVDGSGVDQPIVSYSLRHNAIVSALTTNAQAVAISPACNGLVLAAVTQSDSVRRFTLDRNGILFDTGQQFAAGARPNNILFNPTGEFAFVAGRTGEVSVLSTALPDNITLLETLTASGLQQSLAMTRDGRHLFVLAAAEVGIYSFDPVAGNLTPERSFAHGLSIASFFGVEQIALDASETRLFISANGQVAVFTTYGLPLGTVAGASGPGGLAICRRC